MDALELIVHRVSRGSAISLVERPADYVTHIDLGGGDDYSPLEHLYDRRHLTCDLLFITHPHPDRLADICAARSEFLAPTALQYVDYNRDSITDGIPAHDAPLAEQFFELTSEIPRGDYRGEGTCWWKHWKPEFAAEAFGRDSTMDNAAMLVIYTWRDFKIIITSDQEATAIDYLLNDAEVRARAYRADILIAPRHGSEQGFTRKWLEAIGKPYFTIITSNAGITAAPGYDSPDFARGLTLRGEKRCTLTTSEFGTIAVKMSYTAEGKPAWAFGFE